VSSSREMPFSLSCMPSGSKLLATIAGAGHDNANNQLNAQSASSLDLTCGVAGAAHNVAGGNSCYWTDILCPLFGDCNILCQGHSGCKYARVHCPKIGMCQIRCNGNMEDTCYRMQVFGAEGAAPIITRDSSGGTRFGVELRVLCPTGTAFDNGDFKPAAQLLCPTRSTTTTTAITATPCSQEDSCQFCRDGSVAIQNETTGQIVDGGGHCILDQSDVCVDVYSRQPCRADKSACPSNPWDPLPEAEYLEPVWYQDCNDNGRTIVMGPMGCEGRPNSVGLCVGAR